MAGRENIQEEFRCRLLSHMELARGRLECDIGKTSDSFKRNLIIYMIHV